MEKITLVGHLTSDAGIITGKDNLIGFTVACNQYSDKDDKTTNFYSCIVRKSAVLEYLKKGTKVLVCGNFTPKLRELEGRTFLNLSVFVETLELISSVNKNTD